MIREAILEKGVVYFMSYEIHFDDLASSLLKFGININDFGVDIIEESSSIADLSADFFKATTVDNIEFAQNMEKTTAHVMMNELTLREIRLKLGMTMDEMAEVINVPKSSYSYWESRNRIPEESMQKVHELYNDAMEYIDDGIDIVEKIGTIKRHYKLSYDSLAQMLGTKHGSSIVNWMNGVQPRMKSMIRINEFYYSIVDKKCKAKTGGKATFCQINPLDRQAWKVKTENKVIVWK